MSWLSNALGIDVDVKEKVDEVAAAAVGVPKTLLNNTAKGLNDMGKGITQLGSDAMKELGTSLKSTEKMVGASFENLAYGVKTGDYKPFMYRSVPGLLSTAYGGVAGAVLGGQVAEATGAAMGTDDAKTIMQNKASTERELAAEAAVKAENEQRLSAINSYVQQQIGTRKRTPGRAQTILSSAASNGATLLTRRG